MSARPTVASVDLSRIRENFLELRKLVDTNALVCPMVKANAYGHGDVEVARELRAAGCRHVGVALVEEGIRLRQAGDAGAVLVFGPFYGVDGARELLKHCLTPVVSDWSQLETLLSAVGDEKVALHLEFDTGMQRLGFAWRDAMRLRRWLDGHPSIVLDGVCTHFLRGDDLGTGGDSEIQVKRFSDLLAAFKGLKFSAHLLNSGGAAARAARGSSGIPDSVGFRPGIALYGQQPSSDPRLKLELKAPLSWRTSIATLREVETGETVSYNGTWRASRRSLIGVCPVGYADGYRRALSNRGSVLVRGRRAAIAGIVCMDYLMIDLTEIGQTVAAGEEVVLIGAQGTEEITAHEMAEWIGTISYEVLTGISSRVQREYRGGA